MKKIFTLLSTIAIALSNYAQTIDTIPSKGSDTIRIGSILIITKKKKDNKPKEVDIYTEEKGNNKSKKVAIHIDSTGKKIVSISDDSTDIVLRKKKKRKNITTNLLAWDIGNIFYNDNTNYATATSQGYLRTNGSQAAPTGSDFKLTSASINVNVWLVQQKVNLIKHIVGLKYGLGLEYYNFRYKSKIEFRDDSPSFIVRDSVNLSKNKLLARYISLPLMFTVNPSGKGGFSFSAGATASVMYGGKTKQLTDGRSKFKERGRFGLNPVKIALTADVGYGIARVYGSYNLTNLFEKGLDFTPYVVGVRISRW
jgi:hypothetical protein